MSDVQLPPVHLTHSPSIGALAAALAKAQSVTESAPKNHTAEVTMKSGGKYSYSYADLAGVWDAGRGPLTSNGLSVVQAPTLTPSGLSMTTLLMHSSGEWCRGELKDFPVPDRTPQGVGTSITYARRYTFGAMTGIVSEEDDDGGNGGKPKSRPAKSDARDEAPRPAAVPTLPNYGPAKGAPIRGAELKHLELYADGCRKSLANPEKAKYHAKESALLGAIEAEIQRQRGSAETPPPGEPVSVYEQAMAFLKSAEAPDKVDEALRRAKPKVTATGYAALETVGRQRKEALARVRRADPVAGDGPGPGREPEDDAPPPGDDDAPF